MDEDVHRTVINPLDPDRIYITTGIGMYVSGDGGVTWEQWTDLQHEIGGYPDLLVLHPRRPELMFIASAEKGPGSWRKSHFAGSRVSKRDRKSTRLNSSHLGISYAVFCLKK